MEGNTFILARPWIMKEDQDPALQRKDLKRVGWSHGLSKMVLFEAGTMLSTSSVLEDIPGLREEEDVSSKVTISMLLSLKAP